MAALAEVDFHAHWLDTINTECSVSADYSRGVSRPSICIAFDIGHAAFGIGIGIGIGVASRIEL